MHTFRHVYLGRCLRAASHCSYSSHMFEHGQDLLCMESYHVPIDLYCVQVVGKTRWSRPRGPIRWVRPVTMALTRAALSTTTTTNMREEMQHHHTRPTALPLLHTHHSISIARKASTTALVAQQHSILWPRSRACSLFNDRAM